MSLTVKLPEAPFEIVRDLVCAFESATNRMLSAAVETDLMASVVTSDISKEPMPTAPVPDPTLTVTLEPVTESRVMSAKVIQVKISARLGDTHSLLFEAQPPGLEGERVLALRTECLPAGLRFARRDQLATGLAPVGVRPCWAHKKKPRRLVTCEAFGGFLN